MSEKNTATYIFDIKGIDCADCAAKLESKISQIEGISDVSLSFINETLKYDCAHDEGKKIEEMVRAIAAKEEPDAVITSRGHRHHRHDHEEHEHHDHEHSCECGDHHHEHSCECSEHHHHDHEEETATYIFDIKGIDCADCAAKLESKISQIEGISDVSLSFINETLKYDCAHDEGKKIEEMVRAIAAKEEPDAVITSRGHRHHHHDHEEHEHVHRHAAKGSIRYRITGLDCADCAAKLESRLAAIAGISDVSVSFINSLLSFNCDEHDLERIENEIRSITAKEEPEAEITAYVSEKKDEGHSEEDSDRKMLIRLAAGAVLFAASLVLQGNAQIIVSLASWIVLGYDVLIKAVRGIGRGQIFDEHFLMAVATIAAIYLKDYREAAGVMLFYQIGEYFQDMAVRRSRRSIGELMDIRPDYARVKTDEGYMEVSPEEVEAGEVILVKPGEKIPLDGVIISGASCLNTSSLTGESRLQDVDEGDQVISGAVNETGLIEVRVEKEYGESTVARILELVENSDSRKASHERFITKFSRWYTPAVVFSAIAVALIVGIMMKDANEGIRRACTFLVISCPCALVISIPLSFFAGIGGLSGHGILVKGANVVEELAEVKNVVLDKTGTLTTGRFAVEEILHAENEEELLKDAAYAEHYSNHPLAEGIKAAYKGETDENAITDVREIPGRGLSVRVDGEEILAGNYKLMQESAVECGQENAAGTLVYVARNGRYEGCLVLRDQLKSDAAAAVSMLKKSGKRCSIVSGDHRDITETAAKQTGCDDFHAECLPEDKVRIVSELQKTGTTAFVGDGVNDAPVLTAADVGIAMGALGSDAAIEAADVVIMDDAPSRISLAVTSAQRILKVAKENIWGAIGIKFAILVLGAFGLANMWMAIFADTGVAMLCVLNSLRLLRIAEKKN